MSAVRDEMRKELTGRIIPFWHGLRDDENGGFAGTVQAYVPLDESESFRQEIDRVLGAGACHVLQIRACGASALWDIQEGAE